MTDGTRSKTTTSFLDGRFVYAVRASGVYCRPSCPSRLPKRENTAFFDGPEQAEAAGFRACKRCGGIQAPRKPHEELVGYAIEKTAIGYCLVAIGPRAVMSVELGDSPDTLREAFCAQYTNAVELRTDHAAMRIIKNVVAIVENPKSSHAIPLDFQGTRFQKNVWNALRKIPAGQTATYAQIANAIGKPNAARAVGAACGANRFAVLVPCHRVLRADGTSKGFRWGLGRKKQLLQLGAAA
ncbi:methylated-DNA--[protein]-cysteine S-methyltransferase [Ruegeria sp. R13_0]|uniref:methylated-DNA--[protein]-cysteine S-methyltransferase n=1 Tax=Ruegeria sp. R13_0 TaxID=2821099 RepID=UPI001AD95CD0|nr:methylated-DNA--[protein]-cysteine S-methyltransferase [Ruegeria sp. R13_0]MBO9436667.1 methylated-DNA--[protein]-cysteine S-methyltransferase [Ruegeria sp. R13_0]